MNLTDARIILTGAAGGIGSATASLLAQTGAKLILTDLKQDRLDALAAIFGPNDVLAAVAADVASDAAARRSLPWRAGMKPPC